MNQKTKEILKVIAAIVIPGAGIIATIHYAPKIKEWYVNRKIKKSEENA